MKSDDRLITLVESVSRQVLTGCLWTFGVVAAFAAVAIVAIEVRSPQILFPLILGTLFLWFFWQTMNPPHERIARLLRAHRFEPAFRMAFRHQRAQQVGHYLRDQLKLPSESLRPRIEGAFAELRILHSSVYDQANTFVSPALKKAMQESSDSARAALWNICRNLSVVAHQEVAFPGDHPKVERLAQVLDQLTQSAASARVKLAELSLGANENEVNEAKLAIENVRRQSEALLELEAALAG